MPSPRRLATLVAVLPLAATLLAVPALPARASTTRSELVYTVDADNDGVYALVRQDVETRAVTELLPADTTQQFLYDDPEFSPDGSQVVLASDYQGSSSTPGLTDASGGPALGIIVINRDGGGFRRLTTPPSSTTSSSNDTFGTWSPDGSTIAFTRVTENNDGTVSSGLFTVPSAGGVATPVPNATDGFTADFNPTNGSQLVYAETANTSSGVGPLTVINTDGTGKRALGAAGALPSWSPDGSTIAFAAVTDDDTSATDADVAQIATIPAAGGTASIFASTRPTAARTVAEYPAWTPDGSSIIYDFYAYDASGNEQPGDLWVVDKNGARAGKFTGGPGDEAQVDIQGPPTGAAPIVVGCFPTASASRSDLTVGQQVTIDLRGLTPGRGVSLEGYSAPSATYRELRSAIQPASDGTARFSVGPATNTRYRPRVEGCPEPGDSNVLVVHPVLTLKVVRLGTRSYRFSGLFLPAGVNRGRVIGLYYQPPGGAAVKRGVATVQANGSYTVDLRFTGSGRFSFFFRTGSNTINATGTSNLRSLLVF
jgi:hypothetical protein